MFIMSLYIAFGIGYNLAKSYKLDSLSGARLAVCSLLLTLTPELIDQKGFMLPMTNLGGHGLFVTMIVSILSVEILRFCKSKDVMIKMPEQVPPSVSRSFEALIPSCFCHYYYKYYYRCFSYRLTPCSGPVSCTTRKSW